MAASIKQLDFINKLVSERNVPEPLKAQIFEIARRPDASPARGGPVSQVIDQLLAMPRLPGGGAAAGRAPAAPGAVVSTRAHWLDGIPNARYVLTQAQTDPRTHEVFNGNDKIFIEVREYRGTRYMRRLIGAPGSYTRGKMPFDAVRLLADAIRVVTPLKATQAYGALYSCCSVCGAELTDDTSVALKLGPVCRGRFGL
jgi:hypothetical protein